MEDRKNTFFKDLIIDCDMLNAERYLKAKGIEKHIILKERLLNWIPSGQLAYSMIASTYRYDKRLRLILFKYISYLEEFYRGIILDNFKCKTRRLNWIKDFEEKLVLYNYDLNDALEHIDFSTLLIQAKLLKNKVNNQFGFPCNKSLKDNLFALKELRNAVMHNKFLLLYRGFETCYVDGVDGGQSTSLKANLINLLSFLPIEVAEKCKAEINEASKAKNNDYYKWNLPEMVIIYLK